MSRSNYDKPFYVDIGTSIAAVRVQNAGRDDIALIAPDAIDKIVSDARAAVGEEAGRGNT